MTITFNASEVLQLKVALLLVRDQYRRSGERYQEQHTGELLEKIQLHEMGEGSIRSSESSLGNQMSDIENGKVTPR